MAQTLKLVRKNDFVSDVDSLDLLAFAAGISVQREGFVPSFDGGSEVITLMVKGTTRDNLATNMQALETKFQQIENFIASSVEPYYVVLRDQAPSETSARDSLVTGFSVKLGSSLHQANLLVQEYRLAIDRVPWWEASSSTQVALTAIKCCNVTSPAPAFTLAGSLPGRIGRTTIGQTAGNNIFELWVGFRTARNGTVARFVWPWEIEKAGALGADTALTADAAASPGTGNSAIETTFATVATLAARAYLTAYDLSNTYYADLRGTFDLIARVKVDSGVTANLRLDNGFMYESSFLVGSYGDLVTITNTAYTYYNLGRITWPPMGRVTSALGAMKNACVALYAERTVGAGSVHVDHLMPIPVDEGYAHFGSISVDANHPVECYVDPLGHVEGVQYVSSAPAGKVDTRGTALDTYVMPNSAGIVIVAGQTLLADTVNLTFDVFKRYRSLRGSI